MTDLVASRDVIVMSWSTWTWFWATGHSHHVTIMNALHFMLFFMRNPYAPGALPEGGRDV